MREMKEEFMADRISSQEYFSQKNQTSDKMNKILKAGIDEKIIDFDTAKTLLEVKSNSEENLKKK